MPYVSRDPDGRIVAVHATKTEEAQETLASDDRELRAFLEQTDDSAEIRNALLASDLELIRVLEDLIAVLIDKRIIMLTDLPQAAQHKLAQRYALRSRLADLGGIVAEADQILLP